MALSVHPGCSTSGPRVPLPAARDIRAAAESITSSASVIDDQAGLLLDAYPDGTPQTTLIFTETIKLRSISQDLLDANKAILSRDKECAAKDKEILSLKESLADEQSAGMAKVKWVLRIVGILCLLAGGAAFMLLPPPLPKLRIAGALGAISASALVGLYLLAWIKWIALATVISALLVFTISFWQALHADPTQVSLKKSQIGGFVVSLRSSLKALWSSFFNRMSI